MTSRTCTRLARVTSTDAAAERRPALFFATDTGPTCQPPLTQSLMNTAIFGA